MILHNLPPLRAQWFPSHGSDNDVVVRSDVHLRRNLSHLRFPALMNDEERLAVRRNVEEALQEMERPFHVVDPDRLTPPLVAVARDRGWIAGEQLAPGFVVPDGTLLVRLGGAHHIEIIGRCGGLDFNAARTVAEELDRTLESALEYAVSLQLGYLSAVLEEAGTGLHLSVTLHLSALAESDGMTATGSDETGRVAISGRGGLYELSCTAQFGEGEEQTIATLADFAGRLVHYERAAREELLRAHGDMVAESAHRALGTLLHARRLGPDEAIELLLLVRMAAAAGVLDSVSVETATDAMYGSWGTQIAALCEENDSAAETCRARLIQQMIQPRDKTGD